MCIFVYVHICVCICIWVAPPRSTLKAFGALQVHLEGVENEPYPSRRHCKYRTFPLFLYVAVLWTRLILAIAKSWNLKPESGTWKQEESIGFLLNVKMCFCLLVELSVFVLFCTSSGNGNDFHQKLAFSWRGTQRSQKNQRFWTLQASPSPRL